MFVFTVKYGRWFFLFMYSIGRASLTQIFTGRYLAILSLSIICIQNPQNWHCVLHWPQGNFRSIVNFIWTIWIRIIILTMLEMNFIVHFWFSGFESLQKYANRQTWNILSNYANYCKLWHISWLWGIFFWWLGNVLCTMLSFFTFYK